MNETLVRNWNNTVRKGGTVYFLGDWAYGRGARPAAYWIKQLMGHVISIRGKHDMDTRGLKFYDSKVVHYGGYSFLLVHDPNTTRKPWHGWIIHGHKHNNNIDKYPFINGENKTINVGVELIRYRPISIDYLLSLDIDSIKRMTTIDSEPERW